jgi:hypothetical protein
MGATLNLNHWFVCTLIVLSIHEVGSHALVSTPLFDRGTTGQCTQSARFGNGTKRKSAQVILSVSACENAFMTHGTVSARWQSY